MSEEDIQEKMKIKLDQKADFSQWYNDAIDLANLSDKRYPIKGMNVWTPYGWKVMTNIDSIIRREMDPTGHQEVCFPLLIPKTEFAKEADHIKGFDAEVYWVTHGGLNELDVPLLLRPTSETAMYPMFSLWVRSHNDLPLKIYQIVNTFRYETKQTRSFIRVREIHFFEAHTAHTDFEDAEKQIREDLHVMRSVAMDLCIPYILSKRPDWDKFAGANYSIGIECFLPSGRTLQIGSIHQYKDNFSKAYDIKYEDENGDHVFCHQTTYGMSERLLGAIVGLHGDNSGVIIPPKIAPIQVVLVPILMKGKQDEVLAKCAKLVSMLTAEGIRVHLDKRDLRPGSKFYDWELKGVPLRMEFGPKDMEKGQAVLVRRDNKEKAFVKLDVLASSVKEMLERISEGMLERARQNLEANTIEIKDVKDAYDDHDQVRDVIFVAGWCGEMGCAEEIEKNLDRKILGSELPMDPDFEWEDVDKEKTSCIICGKPTGTKVHLCKSY